MFIKTSIYAYHFFAYKIRFKGQLIKSQLDHDLSQNFGPGQFNCLSFGQFSIIFASMTSRQGEQFQTNMVFFNAFTRFDIANIKSKLLLFYGI